MPEGIKDLIGIAGAPFVVALTQLVKATFPELKARWFPSIAVLWGIILNVVLSFILNTDKPTAIVIGVLTGLIAAGLYGAGKRGET